MWYPMDFINDMDRKVSNYVILQFNEVQAEDLRLDRRSAYRLYVYPGGDCIAVPKRDDRNLQYYGGFEYVDDDARKEMGEWVFYFSDDERVREHLDYYFERNEQAEEA